MARLRRGYAFAFPAAGDCRWPTFCVVSADSFGGRSGQCLCVVVCSWEMAAVQEYSRASAWFVVSILFPELAT